MPEQKRRFKRDADYFLSRMDEDILRSFSTKQIWEIKKAINYATGRPSRKIIDVRFTIPMILARYYFVLFIGRDIRSRKRYHDLPAPVHTANFVFGTLLLACIILFGAAVLLALLYVFKCRLGIDILPDKHLSDLTELI